MIKNRDYSKFVASMWDIHMTPRSLAVRFRASNITYTEAAQALETSAQNVYNWTRRALEGNENGSTRIYLFMRNLAKASEI